MPCSLVSDLRLLAISVDSKGGGVSSPPAYVGGAAGSTGGVTYHLSSTSTTSTDIAVLMGVCQKAAARTTTKPFQWAEAHGGCAKKLRLVTTRRGGSWGCQEASAAFATLVTQCLSHGRQCKYAQQPVLIDTAAMNALNPHTTHPTVSGFIQSGKKRDRKALARLMESLLLGDMT
eukprot:gene25378-11039_t